MLTTLTLWTLMLAAADGLLQEIAVELDGQPIPVNDYTEVNL
jgi:hypothetical protein